MAGLGYLPDTVFTRSVIVNMPGILALIAEFGESARWMASPRLRTEARSSVASVSLLDEKAKEIRTLRELGDTVSAIIKRTGFSKASVYRALAI